MYKTLAILLVLSSCTTLPALHKSDDDSCKGFSGEKITSPDILVKVNKLDDDSLKALLGEKITITGKALNAKLGAILQTEDGEIIWIDNMESWPEGFYSGGDNGKTLKVTGIVIEKYDLPVFIPKEGELVRSGIPVPEGTDLKEASHRFLLKDIKWEIIKD